MLVIKPDEGTILHSTVNMSMWINSLNKENKINYHVSKHRVMSFLKGNVTWQM